jgi:hypothetical protein
MGDFYKLRLILFSFLFGLSGTVIAQSGNNCANAIPLDVVINDCVFDRIDNTGLGNSGQIPATCPGFAGGDIWVSFEMPPSGEVTFTAQAWIELNDTPPPFFIGTPPGMDVNMAVYEGSCGSLTQIGCNNDSGPGLFPQLTFSGTPGETYYVQLWDIGNNQQGSFDVCVNGTATCTQPTVTFNEVCGGLNQYNVEVNISNLGDAPEVNITNNGGADAITGITTSGVQIVGPFSLGEEVTITVEHSTDATCNISEVVTDLGIPCNRVISCGTPLNQTYCYGNNDDTPFLYSSPDNSPITITFNSGLIQNIPGERIIIRNGNNGSAPVLFQGNNGGDLTGLTRTASSGSIWLEVDSDVGGSCQEGSLGLGGGWDWDVTCEGSSACEEALPITSQTTFAASEVSADLALVAASGINQCVGAGGNPDLWYSFTAVGSVQYFRVTASGDFDPVVEVYDSCGGELLACRNEAPAGQRELFWLTDLTIGAAYVYRVYHAGDNPSVTTQFETGVAHIPVIQLRTADCGATGLTTSSIIRANTPNPNFLVSNYEFEFTELSEPFNTYNVISPNGSNPQFIMQWFDEVEPGRSYDVRVRANMYQGPNWGEFGPVCTITMGNPAVTGLQSQWNGGTFQFCDLISANPVPGASNYRWVFDDGDTQIEYNSNSGSFNLQLGNVNGLQYATTYSVEVYATQGGVEAATSSPGTINMISSPPATQLNPASNVACGSTVPASIWTQAFNVCAATSYQFRFTNLSQAVDPIVVTRPNRVVFFGAAALIPGDTYSVAVRATAGGITGDYGPECEVTIAGAMGMEVGSDEADETFSYIDQPNFDTPNTDLKVSLYPNPLAQGNDLNVIVENIDKPSENVEVEIYDLTGKLMHLERFGSPAGTFNATLNVNGKISTGVYLVRTKIDGVVTDTQKLILD